MPKVDEPKRLCELIRGGVSEEKNLKETRASAMETVDFGLIPIGVKPKTIKIGIHSFPA